MIQQTLIPKHIAIIMDGNGRWAKNRKQLRIVGHREGLKAVRRTVKYAHELGVKVLTLYAFSSENNIKLDDINEDVINQEISLCELPPIDLVIRTGGEYRISNFLLWQIAYSELYFTDVLWPDFNKHTLDDAISEFSKRERRFGQVLDS